jgi:Bacterial Ig domain/Carboxypeptidase regulatory-like domain
MFKHSASTLSLCVALLLAFSITFQSFARATGMIVEAKRVNNVEKSAWTDGQKKSAMAVPQDRTSTRSSSRPLTRLANGNAWTPMPLPPVGPNVTATLADDITLAQKKNPGATINYTTVITSTGTSDASSINYTDTLDGNTTQSGTVKVSPVTVNDSYACTGNLSISIPVGSGVLVNDYLGQNPAGTITASDTTSANSGTVAVAADGSFTYDPAAGFTGSDSFHYTLGNTTGSSIGTVTVTVSNKIWFINNAAAACTTSAAGCGRFSHPYSSLSSFTSQNPDASSDRIFIYQGSGSYAGALTLKSNERLIGQGDDLNSTTLGFTPAANGPTLPGATAKPTLTSTLTLATGVTALALDLSTGSSTGMSGTTGSGITVGDSPNTATNGVTVTSTTGTAVSLSNLGGAFTFRSISAGTGASGPTSGISLTNTTGIFTVTGDGNTSVGGDSSGGTIQHTTSDGISLTNAQNLSFTNMNIHDTPGSGILGKTVVNFSFLNGSLNNSGTGGGAETSNIAFNTAVTGTENNVSGTVTITGNSLTNALWNGVDILNSSGTISSANISSNTVTSSTDAASTNGSGVRLIALGSTGTVANVTTATVANNIISNFPSGSGIIVEGGNSSTSGPSGAFGTPGTGNVIAITGNQIKGQSSANKMDGSAIQAAVSGKGQGNFDISNNGTVANPITNMLGTAILCAVNGNTTGTFNVNNNVIVANNTVASNGIGGGTGVTFGASDTPNMTWTITNNNISATDGNGILAVARGATGTLDVKIQNNTVGTPLSGVHEGIRVDAGNASSVNDSVCLNISGNASAGSGGVQGIGLRKQGTVPGTNAFGVNGMAATSSPGVENYVNGLNPAGGGTLLLSATSGFSGCSLAMYRPEMKPPYELAARQNRGSSNCARAGKWSDIESRIGGQVSELEAGQSRSEVARELRGSGLEHHLQLRSRRDVRLSHAENRGVESSRQHNRTNSNSVTPLSGETISFSLPVVLNVGKSVTIKYDATVNTPPGAAFVQTQGSVSGSGFGPVLTTDPETGTAVSTRTNINVDLTWIGVTSTDWDTTTNWNGGYVPLGFSDAKVPNAGQPNQPTLSTSNPTINSLNLGATRVLTINSGHTLTIDGGSGSSSSDLTLDGTITGGALTFGSGTHTIFNASATGNITPTNITTVGNGANVTLNNNLQVDSLTINSGGSLDISNHQLSLTGSLNNASTLTLTGSTVVFNASGGSPVAQTVTNSTSNFNILTINNTSTVGSVSLGSNVTVGGSLNVNAGLFDLQTFTANHTTPAAGQLNIVNGATLKIGGSNSFPANYLAHTFGQTSTVEYGGSGTQLIAALPDYGNLTISGTGPRTLASSGTVGIFTTFTPGTNTYTITGSTIEYNGTSLQTLPSSGFNTYNNLNINNTVGATGFSGLVVQGLLDVKKGTFTTSTTLNNVQIDSGATLAGTNGTTMNVSGNWTNNGGSATSFTANGDTVNLNGSGAQTIGGSTSTTFNNLTIANAGTGVTLGINTSVNGTLTLTNNLNTGANTLTQNNALPTAGNGDVIGNVKRANNGSPLPTGTAYTFGNPFNVITFGAASVLTPTDVTFNLVMAAPSDFTTAVKRTYTITQNNGGVFTATLQLHYLDSDLNGNNETNLKLWRKTATWVNQGALNKDPVNNWVRLNNVAALSPWTIASDATPTAANGNVSGRIVDANGNPVEGAGVRMSGTQNRLTVTDADGYYNFADVEANGFYTVVPSRANFSFSPQQRSFSQLGLHTDAAFTASANGDTQNPLDRTEYFVRQQYVDFLNREPDEAGFNFWVNNIESCGADAQCREARRIDTSAAFFLSIEFQQTGYLVYRTYKAAYGDIPNTPVPLALGEFQPDSRAIGAGVIVNQVDWEQTLASNQQSFMSGFVQRARFAAAYPTTMSPAEFVDKLFTNAGVMSSDDDRMAAINEFASTGTSADTAARARVLRHVAESAALALKEFDSAFVLMQYLGYLRRDPNARPDTNFDGYTFWLTKLDTFNGNYQHAEMVKGFLLSTEYRGRFPR